LEITIWLELILFVGLMGLSGFFSSSETALFSLSSVQLEQMRESKNPRVELIERLLGEPRRLIVTILIGNEFVNVAASVISAAIIIEFLGAQNKFVNLLVMVPILLLVGEITPKTLAIRNNAAFATFQSLPIDYFARLIRPLRLLVRTIADWIITMIVGKERSRGNIITEDMVRTLAHEAVGEGALDNVEAQFIDHIFEFGDKTLEDVMTPRSHIFFLPVEMPLRQMIAELRRSRHTKVPVYEEHRDTVLGILHARDLVGCAIDQLEQGPDGVKSLLREAYFVPESKPAAELFRTFRDRRLSFAMTVDEFGGVTGLVTMEDLLECIFGEIHSPSDARHHYKVRKLGDRYFSIDGACPVTDFNRQTRSTMPADRAETIGGLLLHEYGELPSVGTSITIDGLRFTVMSVEDNRVREVHFERIVRPREEATAVTGTTPAPGQPDSGAAGRDDGQDGQSRGERPPAGSRET
jgi:putative hemolysin